MTSMRVWSQTRRSVYYSFSSLVCTKVFASGTESVKNSIKRTRLMTFKNFKLIEIDLQSKKAKRVLFYHHILILTTKAIRYLIQESDESIIKFQATWLENIHKILSKLTVYYLSHLIFRTILVVANNLFACVFSNFSKIITLALTRGLTRKALTFSVGTIGTSCKFALHLLFSKSL